MIDTKAKVQVIEETEKELLGLLEKRKELEKLDQRIATLRNFIANAKAVWNLNGASEDKPEFPKITVNLREMLRQPDNTEVSFRRSTVAEMIKQVLEAAGQPMHVRQILTALQKRGFHSNAKYPTATIVIALRRRADEFVKVQPNTFALKKWAETRNKT